MARSASRDHEYFENLTNVSETTLILDAFHKHNGMCERKLHGAKSDPASRQIFRMLSDLSRVLHTQTMQYTAAEHALHYFTLVAVLT